VKSVVRKAKLCAAAIGFGLLHFAVFTVSYVQAHVDPSAHAAAWGIVAAVLSVPLVAIAQLASHVDIFPLAVYANSILWGIGCAVLIMKRYQRASTG
jgi:hypothetical protein